MRILHFTPFYPPVTGGVENYVFNLVRRTRAMGHETIVVTSDYPPRLRGDPQVIRLPVYLINGTWGRIPICPTIFMPLKRMQPDIIHVHTPPRFFAESVAFLRHLLDPVPPVVLSYHLHNESLTSFGGIFFNLHNRLIMRRTFNDVNQVIVPNTIYKGIMRDSFGLQEDKIKTIPYGVDCQLFNPERFDDDEVKHKFNITEENVILFVGRLTTQKGIEYLIRAMPTIVREFSDTILLIVGEGKNYNHLQELCERLGIGAHTKFIGEVPYEDVPQIMSLSTVFVLPSMSESFGIVLSEAMAMQKPVVATKVGGIPEVVCEGRTGILVERGSVAQLSDAIISILSDKGKAKDMGYEGRKFVRKYFDWQLVSERIVELYWRVYNGLGSSMTAPLKR